MASVAKSGLPLQLLEWSLRSPDLSPYYFLWGALKDRVYKRNPRSIEELKNAITMDISKINANLCQTVCRSGTACLRQCLVVDGQQFEHLSRADCGSSYKLFIYSLLLLNAFLIMIHLYSSLYNFLRI